MRIRTQLIISDDVMAKIDEIAGERHRRATVVETALRLRETLGGDPGL